jgi:hypothetical protein
MWLRSLCLALLVISMPQASVADPSRWSARIVDVAGDPIAGAECLVLADRTWTAGDSIDRSEVPYSLAAKALSDSDGRVSLDSSSNDKTMLVVMARPAQDDSFLESSLPSQAGWSVHDSRACSRSRSEAASALHDSPLPRSWVARH